MSALTLDAAEGRLVDALSSGSPDRAERLEMFLSALLTECLGERPRATDAFVVLREELGSASYFAAGTLFMIDDQSRHPVVVELSWSPGGGVSEGSAVRLGIAPGSRSAARPYERLETALLASPREADAQLAWACSFDRTPAGWQHTGTTVAQIPKGPATG